MLNLQLCQFVKFLISKSLWKLKYIKDEVHYMMPCQLGLESGLGLGNLTATEMNYPL